MPLVDYLGGKERVDKDGADKDGADKDGTSISPVKTVATGPVMRT
jgi:hypothetical protein